VAAVFLTQRLLAVALAVVEQAAIYQLEVVVEAQILVAAVVEAQAHH
jgi:hypothetical protein